MLIFVSGHHPILGTQMLYFLDPVLNASALPYLRPNGLVTLEDGRRSFNNANRQNPSRDQQTRD